MTEPRGLMAVTLKSSRRKAAKSRAIVLAAPAAKETRQKHAVHRGMTRIWRGTLVTLGGLLVLTGVLIAPLPGPLGMPISIAGLIVVLKNSYWAKRQFVKTHRRYPKWLSPIRRLLRPRAKVMSIVWQQMLRTEKLVLNKAQGRILGGVRRKFLRRSRKPNFSA